MPTGYTAAIKDGITFQQFAMNCARAFGATITMRDEGGDGSSIPERFEPNPLYRQWKETAEAELAALDAMTPEEVEAAALDDYIRAENSRLTYLQEARELREKYEAMLKQVKAWTPPTPEHTRYHAFMIEQIESSINFDCGEGSWSEPTERLDAETWLKVRRDSLLSDIRGHGRLWEEEVERTEQRNRWISDLRASLSAVSAAEAA